MKNFKIILTNLLLCLLIFTLNISDAKSYNLNKTDAENSKISKFIPENSELLFYSNQKNKEINSFFRQKFKNNEIKNINIIKNSLISFLGFELKNNLKNIYDGEFVFSTFKKTNNKRDILIILKMKKDINLNNIIGEINDDKQIDQLIEITRPNNINLITHIYLTDDNFIICSSNKDLIYDSLKALKNNRAKNIRESKFKYYKSLVNNKKLFLYTSKQFYDYVNIGSFNSKDSEFITEFNLVDDQLVLNSFSLNNYKKNIDTIELNLIEKNDIILITNNVNNYQNLLNNSVQKKVYKDLFKDIFNIVKDKILIKIERNNWVVGFENVINNFSTEELTSLNDFHQDIFQEDNYTIKIFSKNNLEFIDQKTIYKTEQPIFTYESNNFTFLSNNLNYLLNTTNNLLTENIFKPASENSIIDDDLIIYKFTNQIYKDFLNIFDSLNYFSTDGFSLSLDTFKSKTIQKIPEMLPSIQLKTYINFS
tara:strand:- start:340 stop:1779 length:1440 start_codon:yes stop_codon:yes gene_type:complete